MGNSTLPVLREGETRFWFLDEVSAVSGDWAQQLKWLRDNDEQFRRDTVVLTGSNARALAEAGGVLAGRRGRGAHLDRILLPMGFRTFATTILRGDVPPGGHLAAAELAHPRSERACTKTQFRGWTGSQGLGNSTCSMEVFLARSPLFSTVNRSQSHLLTTYSTLSPRTCSKPAGFPQSPKWRFSKGYGKALQLRPT